MNGWYRFFYRLGLPFFRLLLPVVVVGRENIPEGGALVCGNHYSNWDPFILAYAFPMQAAVHFMAKAELGRIPLISPLLRKLGVFFIKRGQSDIAALKHAIKLLKDGEKVMMFPEGTRVRAEDASDAKTGAAMLALRTGVPVLPVYIGTKKRLFRPTLVTIGTPYYPQKPEQGRSSQEKYQEAVNDLMDRIHALGETIP